MSRKVVLKDQLNSWKHELNNYVQQVPSPADGLSGASLPLEVYGIDVITADIQVVSVDNVVHRFNDVTLEEIM